MRMYASAPTVIQEQTGTTKDGRPVFKLMRYGVDIEPHGEIAGMCQPVQYKDGRSAFKLIGNSYVALGLPGVLSPVTIAAGVGTGDLQFRDAIQRPGYLGYFQMAGVPAAPSVFLTEIKINGNSVLSGRVSANLFDFNSDISPIFGHFIYNSSSIVVNIFNAGAAPVLIAPSWSLL